MSLQQLSLVILWFRLLLAKWIGIQQILHITQSNKHRNILRQVLCFHVGRMPKMTVLNNGKEEIFYLSRLLLTYQQLQVEKTLEEYLISQQESIRHFHLTQMLYTDVQMGGEL